jgi:hypothetical protein
MHCLAEARPMLPIEAASSPSPGDVPGCRSIVKRLPSSVAQAPMLPSTSDHRTDTDTRATAQTCSARTAQTDDKATRRTTETAEKDYGPYTPFHSQQGETLWVAGG